MNNRKGCKKEISQSTNAESLQKWLLQSFISQHISMAIFFLIVFTAFFLNENK